MKATAYLRHEPRRTTAPMSKEVDPALGQQVRRVEQQAGMY